MSGQIITAVLSAIGPIILGVLGLLKSFKVDRESLEAKVELDFFIELKTKLRAVTVERDKLIEELKECLARAPAKV